MGVISPESSAYICGTACMVSTEPGVCERRETDNVESSDEYGWKWEAAVEYFKVDH